MVHGAVYTGIPKERSSSERAAMSSAQRDALSRRAAWLTSMVAA